MESTIKTYQINIANEPVPSEVTCRISDGVGIGICGMPSREAKESLLRVMTALVSCGIAIPGKKIEISVSPSLQTRPASSLLDTPIAVALLTAMGLCKMDTDSCIVGEVNLFGEARYNPIIEKIVEYHKSKGKSGLLVPKKDFNTLKEFICKH